MEHTIKLKIFLISCLLLAFTSCIPNKYNIIWNSLGVYTDNYISITFWDNISMAEHKYNLFLNQTKYITVPKGAKFIGEEFPIYFKIFIYPNPVSLPNGGDLEIFLFNPIVEQVNQNEYKLKRHEGVEAYFVKFSKNGKRYYSISKDEIISTQNEKIPPDNIEQLLNLVLTEDITFFDEAGTLNYNNSKLFWGGYIVKTMTGSYIWLNSSYP